MQIKKVQIQLLPYNKCEIIKLSTCPEPFPNANFHMRFLLVLLLSTCMLLLRSTCSPLECANTTFCILLELSSLVLHTHLWEILNSSSGAALTLRNSDCKPSVLRLMGNRLSRNRMKKSQLLIHPYSEIHLSTEWPFTHRLQQKSLPCVLWLILSSNQLLSPKFYLLKVCCRS